jgi:putative SOS response-associated peptidase YedK
MCGRFVRKLYANDLAEEFEADEVMTDLEPSFNIAPTQDVAVIVGVTGESQMLRRLVAMRWGLVPWWADDPSVGSRMINARAESLTTKSAFKDSFNKRRCLVLASGFYEWRKSGKEKIPLLFRLKGDRAFAFAGLYDVWNNPLGEPLRTCTIITTTANGLVEPVHDRMPVILARDAEAVWLDKSLEDPKRLLSLLEPYSGDEMEAYEVSPSVNSVKNDSPDLIVPVRLERTGLLF